MEYIFDCDLVGEVLIPLENNLENTGGEDTNIKLENILNNNYKDFRSILFQGELLRFYVVIKLNFTNSFDINNFLNNLYIKFDFDPSCDSNEVELKKLDNISINEENDSSQLLTEIDRISPDLFTLHRNTIFNSFSKPNNNYSNLNYDFISRRKLIADKNIMIFEVIRHVVVPNKFLNKNLIFKLNIMIKNQINYLNSKTYSLCDIYNSAIYNDIKEFSIIKTFFKEVKVIRPLCISKTKQIDISSDQSLLQIKIENITSSINFIDKSLKLSKFLNIINDNDFLNNGMSLTIKEIQLIKEETSIDKRTTINLKNLEQYISNESIPLSNIHFSLLNDNFPIEIKPGEEIVIIVKINKASFIYDNLIKSKNEFSKTELNYTLTSKINKNLIIQNETQTLQTLQTQRDYDNVSQFSINRQKTFADNSSNYPISRINEKIVIQEDPTIDEIIKVILSTPMILNICSFKCYESLFMSIPIKWQNEITRFVKVDIVIQQKIILHDYFNVILNVKNISINVMDLELEIGNYLFSENNPKIEKMLDYKEKRIEEIPTILSETRSQIIGVINPNEEKLVNLRFLPLKMGFNNLPSFLIKERNSLRKFFFVYTNKIYINEI